MTTTRQKSILQLPTSQIIDLHTAPLVMAMLESVPPETGSREVDTIWPYLGEFIHGQYTPAILTKERRVSP